jgi:hypothetical protein
MSQSSSWDGKSTPRKTAIQAYLDILRNLCQLNKASNQTPTKHQAQAPSEGCWSSRVSDKNLPLETSLTFRVPFFWFWITILTSIGCSEVYQNYPHRI